MNCALPLRFSRFSDHRQQHPEYLEQRTGGAQVSQTTSFQSRVTNLFNLDHPGSKHPAPARTSVYWTPRGPADGHLSIMSHLSSEYDDKSSSKCTQCRLSRWTQLCGQKMNGIVHAATSGAVFEKTEAKHVSPSMKGCHPLYSVPPLSTAAWCRQPQKTFEELPKPASIGTTEQSTLDLPLRFRNRYNEKERRTTPLHPAPKTFQHTSCLECADIDL